MNDNLNPDFETNFYLNFNFEKHQPMKFEVIDDDGNGKSDFIGSATTTLGAIVGSKNQQLTLDLKTKPSDTASSGSIILSVDVVKDSNLEIHLKLAAQNLPGITSCFCMSTTNPFFEIYRGTHTDSGKFLKVYDSDPIMNNTNPQFPKFMMRG